MRLILDRERQEPLEWEETLSLAPAEGGQGDVGEVSEIACRGRLDVSEAGFLLQADLKYEQELSCSRCLCSVVVPKESHLDVTILVGAQRPEGERGEEIELEEEDLNVLRVEGDSLETAALVFEQVQLETPMKPLCRPDCAGLCPQCGGDRNENPSCCEPVVTDSRWAALEAMRSRFTEPDRG
jgi:uncharacterized protein